MGWIHMCVLWGSDGSVGAVGVVNLETFNCVLGFQVSGTRDDTPVVLPGRGSSGTRKRDRDRDRDREKRERKRSSKRWGLPFALDTGKHRSSIHGGCHSEVIATLGILATLT